MSRNPYCGGKPPSAWKDVVAAGLAGRASFLTRPAGWLVLLLGIPLLTLSAVGKPLDCPETKSLCVQASRSGGVDLKTGTAILEGDVKGYIRARKLSFTAQSLKAFRNDKNEWARLVLDKNVRLSQPDREAQAAHAVLIPNQILLFGMGRVRQKTFLIEAEEIRLMDDTGKISARGSRDKPAHIESRRTNGGEPDTILMDAEQAVIDEAHGEILLTGNASLLRLELNWRVKGNSVRIELTDDNQLKFFQAEGDVTISQPGRSLRADMAVSRNNNETILLTGNARVKQEGEFELSSHRLEVYVDAKKGVVQSGQRQIPIKLALDLAGDNPYLLNKSRIAELNGKGVPRITLDKLNPLLERSYADRKVFSDSVRKLLTASEAERFLPTIVDHAR
ncbi:MAG: hypothetical protein O7A08_03415 [SAR324 cluster bacterium]|nr:hypothetical protein [SAR324 cluster bacterium]